MPGIRRQTDDDKANIDLYEGEERLARLTVFDLPMRIGDCVVRCDGNGYASQALTDTLAVVREAEHGGRLAGYTTCNNEL